jgi:hypothetical protein
MPGGSVTKIGRTYKKWTYIARNIVMKRKEDQFHEAELFSRNQ